MSYQAPLLQTPDECIQLLSQHLSNLHTLESDFNDPGNSLVTLYQAFFVFYRSLNRHYPFIRTIIDADNVRRTHKQEINGLLSAITVQNRSLKDRLFEFTEDIDAVANRCRATILNYEYEVRPLMDAVENSRH